MIKYSLELSVLVASIYLVGLIILWGHQHEDPLVARAKALQVELTEARRDTHEWASAVDEGCWFCGEDRQETELEYEMHYEYAKSRERRILEDLDSVRRQIESQSSLR